MSSLQPNLSTPHVLPQQPDPLSKSALKKLARRERLKEAKQEKKILRKLEKKRKRTEDAVIAPAESPDVRLNDNPCTTAAPSRKKPRVSKHVAPFNAMVIIDLGFDHLMITKEIESLSNQLSYTYAANRRASRPFAHILCTGFGGRLKERLESIGDGTQHHRWKDVTFREGGYEDLCDESEQFQLRVDRNKLVYLTADADEELEELREGEAYILGGIVDYNRYKNLCQNKAREQNLRSVRLPIDAYLAEMKTRKVLTVNQVFGILLEWTEHRDWGKAFGAVIPKRKLHVAGDKEEEVEVP